MKKCLSTPIVHEEIVLKIDSKTGTEETQWLRSGRFFDCAALGNLPEEVPFACLAMPTDGATEGLAFAHLPLPIKTGTTVMNHAYDPWFLDSFRSQVPYNHGCWMVEP